MDDEENASHATLLEIECPQMRFPESGCGDDRRLSDAQTSPNCQRGERLPLCWARMDCYHLFRPHLFLQERSRRLGPFPLGTIELQETLCYFHRLLCPVPVKLCTRYFVDTPCIVEAER